MPATAALALLDTLKGIADYAATVDADVGLRHSLSVAQAADGVVPERAIADPPLLRLEVEASQAYLSVLLTVSVVGPAEFKAAFGVEQRLVAACMHNLERFEQQSLAAGAAMEADAAGGSGNEATLSATALAAENEALAPLAVATLKAVLSFSPEMFKSRLRDLFPLLTNLISCELAPPEVQKLLSELFSSRIGSMVA